MDVKNIIIIGAMKCGTSSLFDYLKDHPQICPSFVKEPEFFSENMGHKIQGINNYNELFNYNKTHVCTMEASTGYSKYPTENLIPKKIKESKINPHFIYIVRNPFERIESHYNYMNHKNEWEYKITDPHLVNISNYYLQLNEYLKFYNKKDITVIDFDDLKNSPEVIITHILQTLKLDDNYLPDSFNVSNKTYYKSPLLIKLKQHLGFIYNWVPDTIIEKIKKSTSYFLKKSRRILKTDEKYKIHQILEKDMIKLHKEFGINIEKWGFTLPVHKSLE